MRALPALVLLFVASDAFDAGVRAYREGRFEDALAAFTESLSAEQEAEAMVRSFDVDGDGAVTAEDVRELMRHFDDEAELDLWRRVDARTFEAAAETLQAQTRGKARRHNVSKNAVSNAKRGEEIQARYRPEDE